MSYFKYFIFTLLLVGCHSPIVAFKLPSFKNLMVISDKLVVIQFNSPVEFGHVTINPNVHFYTEQGQIHFRESTKAGQHYEIKAVAVNMMGHSLHFKTHFYGYNHNPAGLIFNEFTIRHSAIHKERIELLVTDSGNLASMMLTLGDKMSSNQPFIFPDYEVKKGDFIVILCRGNEGIYNFNWTSIIGLPNKEAILSLYQSENGELMDAVAYYTGDEKSELLMNRILMVDPYMAVVNTKGASPTRSFSRQPNGDWILTKTRGATFGYTNSSLPYQY